MFKDPFVKKILSALAVAGFGFVLLNLAFIFDFLFQSLLLLFFKLFTPVDLAMTLNWFPPMMHGLFVVIIGLLSWVVFRSKLGAFYKAIYMIVPVAVALATLGMFLYLWPVAAYSLGALLCLGVLYYFYRAKQPWLYYYAVILVGLILVIFSLLSGEI